MTAVVGALTLSVGSLVVGAAICCRGGSWTWTAPAVGISALMLVALVAVRLPGHGATAAVALALAVAVSALAVWRSRVDLRPALAGLPAAAVVLGICLLPFLASGRMGELGASVQDDLTFHMEQADVLRELGTSQPVLSDGYPIGPHSLVAGLAEGTGIAVEAGFTGLLLALPLLVALTALAAFDGLSWKLRTIGAALVGIPYLTASYLVQGGFKELLMALCFLGFMLTLREASRAGGMERRNWTALALTAAAAVAAFGAVGLVWPAAGLLWLAIMEYGPRAREGLRLARARLSPLLAAGALAVLAGLVLLVSTSEFFRSGPGQYLTERGAGGNFVGQLPPLQALGIWPAPDFRYSAGAKSWLDPGVALALAVALYGALWCWRRRERALLAAALGGISVYVVARPVTLAYFSGKALVIVAPVLMLIGIRALLGAETGSGGWRTSRGAVRVAAVALLTLMAGYSSALALRAAHVRPQERGPDLAAFRPIVRDASALYLGRDNWVSWELRGAKLAGFQSYKGRRLTHLTERAGKSTDDPPTAVDVDSVPPRTLDRFRYVIMSRTAYASTPAANLEPIAKTRWYTLWKRRGPTPERRILDEGEAPGAILDCRQTRLRRLSREPGVAFVRPEPVVGDASAWRRPDGRPPAGGPGVTTAGHSLVQELALGPGTWEISLRYHSDLPLRARLGAAAHPLPAYLDDSASFFGVGRVRTRGGPLRIEVEAGARRALDIIRTVSLGSVAATRMDDRGREVPLGRACGRYVDWYRVG